MGINAFKMTVKRQKKKKNKKTMVEYALSQ